MHTARSIGRKELLYAEFAGIFILLPALFAFVSRSSPVSALVAVCAVVSVYLYKNPDFDNSAFYSMKKLKGRIWRILSIYLVILPLLYLFTMYFYPDTLFYCIRHKFRLWCIIMIIYPVFSVFPQEVIFRAFLFRRYSGIVSSERTLIHLSAIVFSFAHIIYFNPVAMLLTLGGGYLFAWTYSKTGSLMLVSLEHALYGCTIFSIGLGRFFYAGFDKIIS